MLLPDIPRVMARHCAHGFIGDGCEGRVALEGQGYGGRDSGVSLGLAAVQSKFIGGRLVCR